MVGAQKSGTTSLNYCLSQHPNICTGEKKECHFFDNDTIFTGDHIDYDAYHAMFNPNEQCRVIGECTPSYLYWGDSLARIKRYNPDMKIICVLRNPVDRAYSQWQMEHNRQFETLGFEDAILLEGERLEIEGIKGQHLIYSYLDRGFYAWQVKKMLNIFDREQILFIKAEDMREDMAVTMYEVFRFLELEYYQVDETAQHLGDYKKSLNPQLRNQLIDVFRHDIQELEVVLKWKCNDWLKYAPTPKPVYTQI